MRVGLVAELIALRESERIFNQRGFGTRPFNAFIDELRRQVNTTTSSVEEINTQASSNQQLISRISELEKRQTVIVNTTTDITAKPFQTIVCRNIIPIDVTLELNPIKDDVIDVKRQEAKVRVIGPIDGKTNAIINIIKVSPKFIFDGLEWSQV